MQPIRSRTCKKNLAISQEERGYEVSHANHLNPELGLIINDRQYSRTGYPHSGHNYQRIDRFTLSRTVFSAWITSRRSSCFPLRSSTIIRYRCPSVFKLLICCWVGYSFTSVSAVSLYTSIISDDEIRHHSTVLSVQGFGSE